MGSRRANGNDVGRGSHLRVPPTAQIITMTHNHAPAFETQLLLDICTPLLDEPLQELDIVIHSGNVGRVPAVLVLGEEIGALQTVPLKGVHYPPEAFAARSADDCMAQQILVVQDQVRVVERPRVRDEIHHCAMLLPGRWLL